MRIATTVQGRAWPLASVPGFECQYRGESGGDGAGGASLLDAATGSGSTKACIVHMGREDGIAVMAELSLGNRDLICRVTAPSGAGNRSASVR